MMHKRLLSLLVIQTHIKRWHKHAGKSAFLLLWALCGFKKQPHILTVTQVNENCAKSIKTMLLLTLS
jgi:hypothetical protein